MHDVVWCLLPLTSFLVWYFFLWKTQCGKCDERGSSVGLLRIPRALSHQCVCSHWDPGEGWVWTRVPQQHVPPTGGRSGHAEWRCWHRAGRNELLRLTCSRLARTGHMANVFSPLTQNKTKQNKTRECAVEPRCHCSAEGGAVCHLGKRLLTVLMVHGEVVENTGSFKL